MMERFIKIACSCFHADLVPADRVDSAKWEACSRCQVDARHEARIAADGVCPECGTRCYGVCPR